jgi:hypothetical protein
MRSASFRRIFHDPPSGLPSLGLDPRTRDRTTGPFTDHRSSTREPVSRIEVDTLPFDPLPEGGEIRGETPTHPQPWIEAKGGDSEEDLTLRPPLPEGGE